MRTSDKGVKSALIINLTSKCCSDFSLRTIYFQSSVVCFGLLLPWMLYQQFKNISVYSAEQLFLVRRHGPSIWSKDALDRCDAVEQTSQDHKCICWNIQKPICSLPKIWYRAMTHCISGFNGFMTSKYQIESSEFAPNVPASLPRVTVKFRSVPLVLCTSTVHMSTGTMHDKFMHNLTVFFPKCALQTVQSRIPILLITSLTDSYVSYFTCYPR